MTSSAPRGQSLPDWIQWLQTLHPRAIDLGLHRVAAVARTLELPSSPSARVITVAGTNGKGSTVAALQALLAAAGGPGVRIGVYTSPHLLRFNERVVINGQPCSDAAIIDAFEQVEAARLCSHLPDSPGVVTLSFFEFTTLAAFYLFQQAGLDYWLLEVGLGGRLDAVNLVDPDIAVITQLGLDHQDYLGNTLAEIEAEKAGILRAGIPVVISSQPAPQTVIRIAQSLACDIYAAEPAEATDDGSAALHSSAWAAATQVAELLGQQLPEQELNMLMTSTTVPGRQSVYAWRQREWLLDVAHNPNSVSYLAQSLAEQDRPAIAICAIMADKAIAEMLELLSGTVSHWYFCELESVSRAASAEALAEYWNALCTQMPAGRDISVSLFGNMESALNSAVQHSAAGDRILVFGSFYTVAEALAIIDPPVAG